MPYAKGAKDSGAVNLFLNSLMPSILQALSAGQTGGANLQDFFDQFITDKKGAKNNPFATKIGNGQWLDVGALSESLPGMLADAQDAQIGQFNKSIEKLGTIPAFKGIFDEAAGNFAPQFTADVNAGYESMANQALGVGAQTGFLKDANKQAQILGPLALQKAEFLKSIQKAAEAQKLGLAGAGALGGGNPASLLGAGSQMSFLPGIFQGANMFQQNQQFNAQMQFQQQQLQQQKKMGYWSMFKDVASGFGATG